jgi:uncharacterized membrane protein
MGQPDTLIMFAGVYSDYDSAKADYEAVKDVYAFTDLLDTYDAAVITKKESGKVKIADKHEQPTHHGAWHGATRPCAWRSLVLVASRASGSRRDDR